MRRWSLALCCLLAGGLAGAFLAGPLLQGQAPPAPAVPRELVSYRRIVKKVLPAVVSLEAQGRPGARPMGVPLDDMGLPPQFRHFFEELHPRLRPPGDNQPTEVGFGSGVVVDAGGVILTNFHVVRGAEEVLVQLPDGSKVKTTDILADAKTDVALVRIKPPTRLTALTLGDSDAMEIGDRVLAIGAPFGLTGSVTQGIISAKGRALNMNMYEDFVQTDAAINPGNSGGPLVNLSGEVIGINSVIKSKDGGFQGVGLAISSNLARRIMGRLLRDGVVRRGYLGVQVADVEDPALARRLGIPETGGVLVRQVFPDTPGHRGGLRDGDVITAIAGKPIDSSRDMQSVVADLPLDRATTITVLRDGRPQTLRVTIEEQPGEFGTRRGPVPARTPEARPGPVRLDPIGLEVTDLTPELANRVGFGPTARGALVIHVEGNSLASLADLRPGMLITEVDRKPVASAHAFRRHVEEGSLAEGVLLRIELPRGGTSYVLLKGAGR